MGIVGDHPESGVRVDVQRPRDGGPPWRYEGEARTAQERHPVSAVVAADGTVDVTLQATVQEPADGQPREHGAGPSGLAEKVRLILRSAWKHGQENGAAPPRRIVRWRPPA
jgi:hypothetical protein